MGTRGLYVYRWKGRYYAYYNHWDSYPSGLGAQLVNNIPSDPEDYQRWLQEMRSSYSALAKKLFTISLESFAGATGDRLPDIPDDLNGEPGYSAPQGDLFIEWVYVHDLDRELFSIHHACFFHLSKVSSANFQALMEDSQKYWLGSISPSDIHESIATNEIRPTPLARNPATEFLQLKPTTINPQHESKLNQMPGFVFCKRLSEIFLEKYREDIVQVQDSCTESDVLFREFMFAMLCFASCSPEWVRLVSPWNMLGKGNWACAAILDDQSKKPKEFATRFLRGYHLEGREPGSAPKSTSYWFSGALVYLRRDVISRERFQDAILSAVERGKADGQTNFHAIIVSVKHFILLKYNDGNVQYTKRMNMHALPELVKNAILEFHYEDHEDHEEGEEELDGTEDGEDTESEKDADKREEAQDPGNELGSTTGDDEKKLPEKALLPSTETNATAQEDPDNSDDWCDDTNASTFGILAHFFHAIQIEKLKPSTVHNEGAFPNEVYQRILQFVDRETSIACLNVSRTFREYALETFVMDRGLRAIYRPGQKPACIFENSLLAGVWRSPVFGKSDGSASIEPAISFKIPDRVPESTGPHSATDILSVELLDCLRRRLSTDVGIPPIYPAIVG